MRRRMPPEVIHQSRSAKPPINVEREERKQGTNGRRHDDGLVLVTRHRERPQELQPEPTSPRITHGDQLRPVCGSSIHAQPLLRGDHRSVAQHHGGRIRGTSIGIPHSPNRSNADSLSTIPQRDNYRGEATGCPLRATHIGVILQAWESSMSAKCCVTSAFDLTQNCSLSLLQDASRRARSAS